MVASDCRNFPRIVLTHQPSQHTDTSDRLPGFRSSFGELNLVCWIECKQDTKTGSVRHGRTLYLGQCGHQSEPVPVLPGSVHVWYHHWRFTNESNE